MTSKTDTSGTTNFVWDFENRLKQATKPNGTVVNFKYDALGRRSERNVNGTVWTKFTYDGQDVMLDQNSDGTTVRYLNGLGIDNKLRMQVGTTVSYFLSDHLGSTTAQTDATGNITNTASYDGFGNSANNLSTRYQFTGREKDNAIGLKYYRARWYSSELGRFVSEDPIGFAGGDVNIYNYVGGNPQNFTDPLGLQEVRNCNNQCSQDLDTMKRIFDKTVVDNTANGRRLNTSGELGGWGNNFAVTVFAAQNFAPKLIFGKGLYPELEGCIWQAENLRDNLNDGNYNLNWKMDVGHDFYGNENVNPDDVDWTSHKWTKVVPVPVNDNRPSFRFDAWKNEWRVIE